MSSPAPARPPGVYRRVVTLAYPVVFATLATTLMAVVDTLFMGWVGTAAQGAVGLGGILVWTYASFFIGAINVVNTFVAQHHGAGNLRTCGAVTWQGLALAAACSAVVLALLPALPPVVGLFGAPADVTAIAVAYATIRIWWLPLDLAEAALSSFMRGIGDTRTPMFITLGAVAINVPLNYWLIFGGPGVPAMGAEGAAWATVIARGLSLATFFALFLRRGWRRRYGTAPRLRGLLGGQLAAMVRVGLPIGVGWFLETVTWLVFTGFIASFGRVALAAHNIVLQVIHLSFMPGIGISVAATTLVGQRLGAGDPAGARRSGNAALTVGMGFMGAMGLLFLTLGGPIATAFNRDPGVVSIARVLFVEAAAFQLFDAMGMVSGGILRGAGDTRFPMLAGIGFAWLVFVPLVWLLGFHLGWGVTGAWLGAVAYIVGLGVVQLARVRSDRWTRHVLVG